MSDQTIDAQGRELVLTRTFAAPPSRVFAAYSSCEHLKNWWGPRSWPMAECTMEFRVGGVWHYCLRGPNPADESWGRAVFEEIDEPTRIVYTDTFSDAEGNVSEEMPQTRSALTFEEVDGRTRLTMRSVWGSPEELQQVLEMGMEAGITETLDRLEEHVTGSAA